MPVRWEKKPIEMYLALHNGSGLRISPASQVLVIFFKLNTTASGTISAQEKSAIRSVLALPSFKKHFSRASNAT
jgi:hypothetical protein